MEKISLLFNEIQLISVPGRKKHEDAHYRYILAMFVIASSLVFGVLFAIVLTPSIVTRFGYQPVLLLLMAATGVTSAMLAILFYMVLRRDIRF